MKPKIKFGAIDIVIGVLLVIAITFNVWVYTRPRAKGLVDQRAPINIDDTLVTDLPENEVEVIPETEPLALETVTEMTFEVDGEAGVYTGEILKGIPEGNGVFYSNPPEGWSYDGEWMGGLIHGSGVLTDNNSVFKGSFSEGNMTGEFEVYTDEILRYRGGISDGKLSGFGTLFTATGTLIYEGAFADDMLVEKDGDRIARGEIFSQTCMDMNEDLYYAVMEGESIVGTKVHVQGEILGASEQDSTGVIIISSMHDISMPVAVSYRYGVDEPKTTEYSSINVWGVVTGIYTYDEQANGIASICPMIEALYLTGE